MWDPQEFERHWQAEFPGAEAPVMRLDSVLDMEQELERCKLNLKRLQQVLAEEKFKVVHLQAALAGEPSEPGCARLRGGDGASSGPPGSSRPERALPTRGEESSADSVGDPPGSARPAAAEVTTHAKAETPPWAGLDLPAWPAPAPAPVPGSGGAVRSLTAAIHQQLLQPRLLFGPREDRASPGRHEGTALGSPPEELAARTTRAGRGSEDAEPDASGADDGGDGSDHDFEMVDLNEKFVLSHLLVGPCRLGSRDGAEKPARACSPHRLLHLIPRGRRQRRSRDLEPQEAETKDGRASPRGMEEPPRRGAREHLPGWRRKRFLRVPERDSPGHSSPERGSDCSRNSSDHEDGFSTGKEPLFTAPPPRTPSLPRPGQGTGACAALPGAPGFSVIWGSPGKKIYLFTWKPLVEFKK